MTTDVHDALPAELLDAARLLSLTRAQSLRWHKAGRALRWRRVQHVWTAWMRGSGDALPCARPPVLLNVPLPVCAAAVMHTALPFMVGSVAVVRATAAVAVCAAVVRATAAECAKESIDGLRVRQRRRGVRGGRRGASRRAAKC